MVELTVDGKTVEVPEGSMVMQAANALDIYIPHFCYHKKLSIAANCRMCLVEVEKAPKPLPACATPVSAGMVVRTQSPKAIQAQKGVMEFLLINHPLDCPICDQGGECQLQDLAVGYGASASRYQEEKRVVFNKYLGPLVSAQEMTRCIHCTRCVRFGQEIAGLMELGMLNRGEHAQITSFLGTTVDSELSGNMIDVCPVGALTSKPFRYSARPWELARRRSISPHDSLGSNLIVQVRGDRVMRVLPFENEAINECWLSDRDRFSYLGLNSDDRLTEPMMKGADGQWSPVTWNDALTHVASTLQAIKDTKGAAAIGAITTAQATLEEFSLLAQVIRGLGSDNIDFRLRQTDFSGDAVTEGQIQATSWQGVRNADLKNYDRVLVIGSFLRKDHPLLTQRLRQLAKQDTQIGIIHVSDEDPLLTVSQKLLVLPSALPLALESLYVAIAQQLKHPLPLRWQALVPETQVQALAQFLISGQHRAILLGSVVVNHPQAEHLKQLARAVGDLLSTSVATTDSTITSPSSAVVGQLSDGPNVWGGYLAKAVPQHQGANAQQMLTSPVATSANALTSPQAVNAKPATVTLRSYVVMHAEPPLDADHGLQALQVLQAADFNVALTSYRSAAQAWAHIMLPIAPFTETSGTFISGEGRVQSFNAVVRPLGQTRPAWKVLRVLGNLLQLPGFQEESSHEVRDALLPALKQNLTTHAEALLEPAHQNTPASTDVDHLLAAATLADVKEQAINPPANYVTLERVADVPIYGGDPIVRRSEPLQQTREAQVNVIRIDAATAQQLQVQSGDILRATHTSGNSLALACRIETTVLAGTVRIATATEASLNLGPAHGLITLEKA